MVKQNHTLIEVEVDGPLNENWVFPPLQRNIRGRFDFNRVAEPRAREQIAQWPEPIPGQVVGIDTVSGDAYIRDLLNEDEHAETKSRVERQGYRVPDVEELSAQDIPTWLFWMKKAADNGICRVTKGAIPDEIDGEPETEFIIKRERDKNQDKLTDVLDKMSAVLDKLADKL